MKRASERQLTKENPEDDSGDEINSVQSGFQRAPPEVIAKRRIVRVRRTMTRVSNGTEISSPTSAAASTAPTAINPFASLASGTMTKTQPTTTKACLVDVAKSNKRDRDENESTTTPDKAAGGKPELDMGAPPSKAKRVCLEKSPSDKQDVEERALSDVKEEEKGIATPEVNNSEKALEEVKTVVMGTKNSVERVAHKDGSPTPQSNVTTTVQEAHSSLQISANNESDETLKKDEATVEQVTTTPSLVENAEVSGIKDNKDGNENGEDRTKENGESTTYEKETKVTQVSVEKEGSVVKKEDNGENSPANTEKGLNSNKEDLIEGDANAKTDSQKVAEAESKMKPSSETVKEGQKVNTGNTGITFGGISGSTPVLTFASAAKGSEGSFGFAGFSKESVENTGSEFKYTSNSVESKREFKEEKVDSGEEGEDKLFCARAKLYLLEDNDGVARWKERGVGSLKVKRNRETGQGRLLMRTEATLRVVLNSPLYKAFTADKASERSIRFQGFNHENPDVDASDEKIACFLVRFSTKDTVQAFIDAVEKWKEENAVKTT